MPKISIIVPVYNTEKYLNECLNSIINQTLYDIEIICINDGSTDNSLSILEDLASKDSRIIIINKKNEGVGITRNLGFKKASGKYIFCLDNDDCISLNTCKTLHKIGEEYQTDMLQIKKLTSFYSDLAPLNIEMVKV